MLKEKIKPIHIALILAVILIYGYLFGLFSSSDSNNGIIQLDNIKTSDIKQETVRFPKHRNDPFLSAVPKRAASKPKKRPNPEVKKVVKPKITLPHFKIVGISENNATRQISLIMNNQFFLLNEKEVFFGIKIMEIGQDSLNFEYGGKTFKQKRPRF